MGRARLEWKQRNYNLAFAKLSAAREACPDSSAIVDQQYADFLREIAALFEKAERERIRADKEAHTARQALAALEKSSAEVVAAYLGQARDLIYHLQYAEAEIQIKKAAAIGVKKVEVARALIEIAYIHAHTGRTDSAQSEAMLVARLLGAPAGPVARIALQAPKADSLLLAQLRALEPALFDTLQLRYFPEMLPVPGGVFWMGRDSSVEDGGDNELPRHQVELSPYEMAKTETTLWQYGLFCAAAGRNIKEKHYESWGPLRGDDPVIYVSWYDAAEYANWCSVRQGFQRVYHIDSSSQEQGWLVTIPDSAANGYRLPTEAEWERAARYAPSGEYMVYSGAADESELDSVAWYYRNSSRTNPVGTKRPNALGLHDLTGNVWEWCWDGYGAYPSGPVSNPKGPDEGSHRVVRGGSWSNDPTYCRVAYRFSNTPDDRLNRVGFRLARTF